MRSDAVSPATDPDLTARARIRDAAIRRFAMDGMGAPLRAIASDAGVSPALILHHFGSRTGLREACDDHVLAQMRDSKETVLGSSPAAAGGSMLVQLAQVEGYAVLVGYVLRCLQDGGPALRRFVDHVVADAVAYLHQAEVAGLMRPSRFPEARARLMSEQALGALLLQLPAQQERLDLDELPTWLREYSEQIIGPVLEMYTEPVLTDSTLLDTYLSAREAAASTGARPASARRPSTDHT